MNQVIEHRGTGEIVPQNMDDLARMATMIAKSDFAPKSYRGKVENVASAIMMGRGVGMSPMQSVQNIAVINGKPSIYGDGMAALIQSAPDLVAFDETQQDDGTWICTIHRDGRSPVTRHFTREMAKRAGLIGKAGPWSQYETRMFQMRSRSWAGRDTYSDRLNGLYPAEEAQDIPASARDITPEIKQVSSKQISDPDAYLENERPIITDEEIADELETITGCARQPNGQSKARARFADLSKENPMLATLFRGWAELGDFISWNVEIGDQRRTQMDADSVGATMDGNGDVDERDCVEPDDMANGKD